MAIFLPFRPSYFCPPPPQGTAIPPHANGGVGQWHPVAVRSEQLARQRADARRGGARR